MCASCFRPRQWAAASRRIVVARQRHAQYEPPKLTFVTPDNATCCINAMVLIAQQAVHGGCGAVQVRVPASISSSRAELAAQLVAALRQSTAAVLVGDGDVDAAVQSQAAGVHFPERLLSAQSVAQARLALAANACGQRKLCVADAECVSEGQDGAAVIGASVHSVQGAIQAAALGVDYIQVGTIYMTKTHPEKTMGELEGLQLVKDICASVAAGEMRAVPLVGIGGVDEGNCGAVLDAGAAGVAVIRGISDATDPREAARAIMQALDA